MKFTVPSLKLGQVVKGMIVECLSTGELIVSFRGDLLRVSNQTQKSFLPNTLLDLEVTSENPLQFKIFDKPQRLFEKRV